MKKIDRNEEGKLVLGDGETTGNLHVIGTPGVEMYDVGESMRMLSIPSAATLRHENHGRPAEHRDIQLPAGEPNVIHKRQYNAESGWTRVTD